ncbi:MAG: type II secretion system major pseudopilin GspG [Luteolibacter sp.]
MKTTNPIKQNRRKTANGGFTLLEIVIVLGIIAVILGGAIYKLAPIGDAAKLQRVSSDFGTIGISLDTYKLNAGMYPTTAQGLEALVVKPTTTPKPKIWTPVLKEVPMDPWLNPYLFRNPGKLDPSTYEIYSKGPDGQEGTDDDMSSQGK